MHGKCFYFTIITASSRLVEDSNSTTKDLPSILAFVTLVSVRLSEVCALRAVKRSVLVWTSRYDLSSYISVFPITAVSKAARGSAA